MAASLSWLATEVLRRTNGIASNVTVQDDYGAHASAAWPFPKAPFCVERVVVDASCAELNDVQQCRAGPLIGRLVDQVYAAWNPHAVGM